MPVSRLRQFRNRFTPHGVAQAANAVHGVYRLGKYYQSARALRSKTKASSSRRTKRKFRGKKRKRRQNFDQAASSGITIKGRRRMKGLFKGLKKAMGPRVVRSLTSTHIGYSTNSQAAVELNMFYNGVSNFTYMVGFADIAEMVKNLRLDQYEPITSEFSWRTMKFWIPKVRTVHRIRNMGTAPTNITIYNVVARKDQNTAVKSPIAAWGDGIFNASSLEIGTTEMEVSDPGVTPFQSGRFTNLFKVVKVTDFTLHAGSTHKHYLTVYPNKIWTLENTAEMTYNSGESAFIILVCKGDVGNAPSGAEPAVPVPAYTPGLVEIVTEYKATIQAMEKNRSIQTWYSSLVKDPAPAPIKQVVEDTDIVSEVVTVMS